MRGSVRIQIQMAPDSRKDRIGNDDAFIEADHFEAAALTFRSTEGEAILSRAVNGELIEVLFLEHATIDIFSDGDADNQNNVEVRGFSRITRGSAEFPGDSDRPALSEYRLYRLLFSPSLTDDHRT